MLSSNSKQKKEEEKLKKEQERIKREEEKQEKLRQKEAEKLKREEEKRKKDEEKEQERLRKEEERLKKEEERLKKEEEKRKKDAEREQERLKKEEERLKKEEEKRRKDEEKEQERLKREEEKRKKEEEKEQQRLKREDEKVKKEAERKQKQEEKDREKLKLEEKANKQADFLKSFLNKTPGGGRKSGGTGTASANQSFNSSILDSSATLDDSDSPQKEKNASGGRPRPGDIEVIEVSENDDGGVPCPKIPRSDFHPMPFQVKNGMALAPVLRRASLNIFEKHSVDKMVHPSKKIQIDATDLDSVKDEDVKCDVNAAVTNGEVPMDVDNPDPVSTDVSEMEVRTAEVETAVIPPFTSYLELLKKGFGRKSSRTEVIKHNDDEGGDDIEVLDPKSILMTSHMQAGLKKLRYKLLHFHDNLRPAYWGTWRKKPLKVNPRRPFAQEEELDYEFESGDEWEEEPEDGEDLNSDNEDADKKEDAEGNEADQPDPDEEMDAWMVPHGYLSDEEAGGQHLDKEKLKSMEEEFYKEYNRQEHKLGLPTIETEDLSDYEMLFPPKKRKRCLKSRKAATEFNEMSKTGNLVSDGITELSSDEEDGDWEEVNDSDSERSDAEDSDASDNSDSLSSASEDEASEDDLMPKKEKRQVDTPAGEPEADAEADDEDEDENGEMSMDSADADSSTSFSNQTDNSEAEPDGEEADEDQKIEGMDMDADDTPAVPDIDIKPIDTEPAVPVQ